MVSARPSKNPCVCEALIGFGCEPGAESFRVPQCCNDWVPKGPVRALRASMAWWRTSGSGSVFCFARLFGDGFGMPLLDAGRPVYALLGSVLASNSGRELSERGSVVLTGAW